jgi:hypothetical protein
MIIEGELTAGGYEQPRWSHVRRGALVRIVPTRGGPRLHNLIRLFQPFRGHRHDQTTQERPLGFVFVSRIGIRFAFYAASPTAGLLSPLLPPRASFQREAPHGLR